MSFNANALRLDVSRRPGFAFVELLTVVALAFLTLSLLTPAVLQSRAAGRRDQCADNLKRLALAVQSYRDANGAHPIGQDGNDLDYGFRVALLPYLGETATYDVATRYRADGVRFGETGADLREKRFDFYACPADPAAQNVVDGFAPASYVASYGDYCPKVEPWNAETYAETARFGAERNLVARNSRLFRNGSRGAIQPKIWSGVADVIDGTSNTALFSETLVAVPNARTFRDGLAVERADVFGAGPDRDSCERPGFAPRACLNLAADDGSGDLRSGVVVDRARGKRWGDGRLPFAAFSTILPPNSPNCALGQVGDDGANLQLLSATSAHSGGVNVALVDGSVRFVSDEIDCGYLTYSPNPDGSFPPDGPRCVASGKSPFGVWGALGSRFGGETRDSTWNQYLGDATPVKTSSARSLRRNDRPASFSGVATLDGSPLADARLALVPTSLDGR
ncbi:MAG: DUF1559 domain-containing protein, partial [Thermoguttaceae bacterium]|nr:DUF1559 domain-containing protein [Thermoguttaceae bacterium]